jgi:hypothetical protein
MLPVFAYLHNITAELVTNDRGCQIASVGHTLVVASLKSGLITGHAQTIGHNTNPNTVRTDFGQLHIV